MKLSVGKLRKSEIAREKTQGRRRGAEATKKKSNIFILLLDVRHEPTTVYGCRAEIGMPFAIFFSLPKGVRIVKRLLSASDYRRRIPSLKEINKPNDCTKETESNNAER